eukprot:6212425-Pleurochrysis_carterae.AAC.13
MLILNVAPSVRDAMLSRKSSLAATIRLPCTSPPLRQRWSQRLVAGHAGGCCGCAGSASAARTSKGTHGITRLLEDKPCEGCVGVSGRTSTAGIREECKSKHSLD